MKKKNLKRLLKLSIETIEMRDEEISKLHSEIVSKKITIPFAKKTKHELFSLEHQIESMSVSEWVEKNVADVSFPVPSKTVVDAPTTSEDEKEVVDDAISFSSRFMPNVKFTVDIYSFHSSPMCELPSIVAAKIIKYPYFID